MGASFSACVSGSCAQDGSAEFSEVLSATNEPQLDANCAADGPVAVPPPLDRVDTQAIDPSEIQPIEHMTIDVDEDRRSTESGSQESVMSAISPTKDRAPSPKKRLDRPVLAELHLNNIHSKEEDVIGKWTELSSLIEKGIIADISTFVQEHHLKPPSLRYEDKNRTVLHAAVLYNQPQVVQYFIDEGVSINVKDAEGLTAMGLAYQSGNTDIVNLLARAKAMEFAGSPYSPYALSVASGAQSVRSQQVLASPTPAAAPAAEHTATLFVQDADSPASSMGGWTTPRSRALSEDLSATAPGGVPVQRDAPGRGDMVPPLDFLRSPRPPPLYPTPHSAQSTQPSANKERPRAFSMPANSPTFEAARARSPTDPPLVLVMPPMSYSADNTPLEGSSPRSTLSITDPSGGVTGVARPPLGKRKDRKPLGSRLRKAAGKAIAMIVPSRGLPPRHPPSAVTKATASTSEASGATSHEETGDAVEEAEARSQSGSA